MVNVMTEVCTCACRTALMCLVSLGPVVCRPVQHYNNVNLNKSAT